MRLRAYIIIMLILLAATALQAAYLRNIPQTLVQPNGDTVHCYATGDEFYHRLHDQDEFTIVKSPATGYWVYADTADGTIVASFHVVGSVDPVSVGLQPGLKISKEEYQRRRVNFSAGADAGKTPHFGTIEGLCVFIRFNDDPEFSDQRLTYDNLFNSTTPGDNSVANYYGEVSYQQLAINTNLYPVCPLTTNLSYQDGNDRSFYQPFNAVTNPNGYQGGNNGAERKIREHTLLRDAVNFIAAEVVGLDIDADADDTLDLITFIIYGGPDGWSDLLWPHKWQLDTLNVQINGERVWTYTFVMQTTFEVGTTCHEIFHALGSPDLYHYNDTLDLQPVYRWDLMEWDQNPPQHMGAYMKERYGEWIAAIPQITTGGSYVLNPLVSPTNNSLRIASPNSSTEYFVVEYRRKEGPFESSIPGTGLLVYRINSSLDGRGNRNGPPDEVYIYRPGGTTITNGTPANANFRSGVGRTYITNDSDPGSFLSDGSDGDLFIADVGSATGMIDFYLSPNYVPLAGLVSDGSGGPLNPLSNSDVYWTRASVTTPNLQILTVPNGARIYSSPNVKYTSNGAINFETGSSWTRFYALSHYRAGIKSKGEIKMTNGGQIKFH